MFLSEKKPPNPEDRRRTPAGDKGWQSETIKDSPKFLRKNPTMSGNEQSKDGQLIAQEQLHP